MDRQIETPEANRLATGAPGVIVLGGQTYLLGQPTDADFVTLRKHMSKVWASKNTTPLTAVALELQSMPKELAAIVGERAIARAVDRKDGNKTPESADIQAMLFEPDGASFWCWLLCRKNHPDLKLTTVRENVNNDNVDQLLADMLVASSMKDADPNSVGGTGSKS